MDDFLAQFLIEAREQLTAAMIDLTALQRDPEDRRHLDGAFRAFHTLKGSVALFEMTPAGQVLHAAEDLLEKARKKAFTLDDGKLAALVSCIDRVDAWVDAMENEGSMPEAAAGEAQALLTRLGQTPAAPSAFGNSDGSDWLPALLARGFDTAVPQDGGLTAFRYEPDGECFFRGDDPLAIVANVPKLRALKILPTQPWPSLEGMEPFRCNLVLEGLAEAGVDEVATALRLIKDQARILPVVATIQADDVSPGGSARMLRIPVERIDTLANGVGELVVAGNALGALVAEAISLNHSFGSRLRQVQSALEHGIGYMRRSVTSVKMVPAGAAVRRLPRIVRDVAAGLGRQVDFAIEGEQVECDKAIADALYEPLLHLVRNALDHGIERPERRLSLGKSAQGKLRLRFLRAGDKLLAELEDDGAGIDPARIRRIAIERKLLTPAEAQGLSDEAVQALIFTAGFSTAEKVSDISGRGVGMDAVKASLAHLGGRVELRSRVGQGTLIRIVLPLNAITSRMLVVTAGEQHYAVPFESIVETTIVASARIRPVGEHQAIVIRDRTVPVVYLRELLGESPQRSPETKLMVTTVGDEPVAIAVDGFGERIEAMVRPAAGLLAGLPGIGGTTLLATGDVMLVLDLGGLVA
jgi:two-component system, chemotaxis family, sensor kinase CheA